MIIIEGNNWNDPETIYITMSGTTNDFATMFINIAYVNFGIEFDLAIIDTREWFGEFGRKYDAMISFEGIIFNIYNMKKYFPIKPFYLYKFEEVFLKLPTLGTEV
jgi:hypothetical protein